MHAYVHAYVHACMNACIPFHTHTYTYDFVTAQAHFCDFPTALLTLFRCATGEDWNGLMHEATEQTWLALPFFVSYEVLSKFVVLKMAIALINDNYKMALKRDNSALSSADADRFVAAWSQFDEGASGKMPVRHLRKLIIGLEPPLGLDPLRHGTLGHVGDSDVSRYIFRMNLRAHHDPHAEPLEPIVYVKFTEVLACLVKDAHSLAC
mgnify:CR=1 FL=1